MLCTCAKRSRQSLPYPAVRGHEAGRAARTWAEGVTSTPGGWRG